MTIKELRQKSPAELEQLIQESELKLREQRFQLATRQAKNPHASRMMRQTIARAKTLLAAVTSSHV